MAKYLSAELHSNGETVAFATPEDAKRLRDNFTAHYFKNAGGTKEYGVTANASTYVVLTIDQTATPLAPKPNCDNYGSCLESVSDSSSTSALASDTASESTSV